jgi:hypothetical protein
VGKPDGLDRHTDNLVSMILPPPSFAGCQRPASIGNRHSLPVEIELTIGTPKDTLIEQDTLDVNVL